jgi:hypothetical protein
MSILGITFKEFIQKGNVIAGIIFAILGVATWILAMNVAKVIRKQEVIKPEDTILVGCKVTGLVLLLIGMILIAIPL